MRGYLGNQARNRPGNKGGGGGGGRPNRGGNNDNRGNRGDRGDRGDRGPQGPQHDDLPVDDAFDGDDVGVISPAELAASRQSMKRWASGPEPGSTSARARWASSKTDSSTFRGRTP